MANVFLNLPVPAADGSGASVDTSSLGATRTIAIAGDLVGAVTVEISPDNATWRPLYTFGELGKRTFTVCAPWMRCTVSNYRSGSANCDVGGQDDGVQTLQPVAPAGNGSGAALDISALGTVNTVLVTGVYTGNVLLEFSQDNTDWVPLCSFGASGGSRTISFVAQFLRVTRQSVNAGAPGLPVVHICAANDTGALPPHAASHEDGGGDELDVTNLSGVLADPQTPATHAVSHEDGGGDEIDVTNLSGVLADPQTPAAHATAHELGGSDAIDGAHVATTQGTLSEAGGNVIPDLDAHGACWNLVLTANAWTVGVPLNPTPGMTICMRIEQGNAGGYTLAWNAIWLWPGGTAPTITPALGSVDLVSAYYDGTNWLANAVQDFS